MGSTVVVEVSAVGTKTNSALPFNDGASFGPDTPNTLTVGIAEAIAAVGLAGGGIVSLRAGTFTINNIGGTGGPATPALSISSSSVHLQGSGSGSTIIAFVGASGKSFEGIVLGSTLTYVSDVGVADLSITFSSSGTTGTNNVVRVGNTTKGVAQIRIENVSLNDKSGNQSAAVSHELLQVVCSSLSESGYFWIRGCAFLLPSPVPTNLTANALNLVLTGLTAQSQMPVNIVIEGNNFGATPYANLFVVSAPTFANWVLDIWTWAANVGSVSSSAGTELAWNVLPPTGAQGSAPVASTDYYNQNPWPIIAYFPSYTGTAKVTDSNAGSVTLPSACTAIRLDPGFKINFPTVAPTAWYWYGVR